MSVEKEFDGDAGAPLPDFSSASSIQLQTVAPALGLHGAALGVGAAQPDYLDYDMKRSMVTVMFANTGLAYFLGTFGGGVYGLKQGLAATPSSRFKVQLNSVLNHCGRYGSRTGNTLGVGAVLYSFYEGVADNLDIEDKLGLRYISPTLGSTASPVFAAFMTGATYYAPSGLRVASLAGTIGFGVVGTTYIGYYLLGIPFGSQKFLFL